MTNYSGNGMDEPVEKCGRIRASPPTLAYGRRSRTTMTPEQERRFVLWFFGVTLTIWISWCVAMFLNCRPAIDYPFVLAFASPVLGAVWLALGWQVLTLTRRNPSERRFFFRSLMVACFLLAPYTLMRTGGDVFALSVRYHLRRAGGADKVRSEFNQWVAARAASRGGFLFYDVAPGGGAMVPVPAASLPPSVRYMDDHFPSRSGGMTWNGIARLDEVTAFTDTVIMIGPPAWEPDQGAGVIAHITGSRRKLADGIWLEIGTYDK